MYKAFLQTGDTERAARERRRWMPHMKKWVTGILQRTASGKDLDWTDRFAVGIPAILLAACQTVGCRISIEYHTSVHRTMQSWLEQVPIAGWILWWIAETLLLDRCCDGCLYMQGETRQFRRTVSGKVSEREYFDFCRIVDSLAAGASFP